MDIFKKAESLITHYKHGAVSIGNKGYKMRWGDFIGIAHLYLNGVDAKLPDLLDSKSKNTFIQDFLGQLEKVHEQVRIDFKEIGFGIDFAPELAEFIAKAANRKVLTEDNNWTEIQEQVTDSANWYGDGYKKIWINGKGKQKHKKIDVWNLVWDLENFDTSVKVEIIRKSVKDIVENERYDETARTDLKQRYFQDNLETKYIDLVQYIDNEKMYILGLTEKLKFLEVPRPEVKYIRYVYTLRDGKVGSPGRGLFERIMNVIIQSKVARERLEEVQAITSKLLFAKVKSGKGDKVVGKQYQNLKTGLMIPVLDEKEIPKVIELGGSKQIIELQNKINEMRGLTADIWNTPDVLRGDSKELGAGSSGIAIQSLAEYASSVHKDVKKRYARVAEKEYKNYILPYVLQVFKSTENIKKYLTSIEFNVVRKHIIDFQLVQKQIDAEISGEDFDAVIEREKLERAIKDKNIISKELLEKLRRNVKGIKVKISGEKASRQVRNEFMQNLKIDYLNAKNAGRDILQDKVYLGIMKKQASINGIDELEITEFINSNLK